VRVARSKADFVRARCRDGLILAADTAVVLDDSGGPAILGKPRDAAEAHAMLRRLSGREHRVLSGVALATPDGETHSDVITTRVWFSDLSPELIEWYVATGEPMDKAGAYGLQGAAALFVSRVEGSWTNVVGLPLDRLPALFTSAGYRIAEALGPIAGP
jgi:nucleoside triphosphate pyrophosphatase